MKTGRKRFALIAIGLLAIALLYVLASGPLYRFAKASDDHDWILWKCVDALYRPLLSAAAATHLHQPMLHYLHRWKVPTSLRIVDLAPGAQSIQIRVLPPYLGVHGRVYHPSSQPSTPAPAAAPQP